MDLGDMETKFGFTKYCRETLEWMKSVQERTASPISSENAVKSI